MTTSVSRGMRKIRDAVGEVLTALLDAEREKLSKIERLAAMTQTAREQRDGIVRNSGDPDAVGVRSERDVDSS